ncbi:MAG: hypothetical protein IT383_03005 [Deltaproteobacteria bacterium]|nr:hypothetical protein [Deltaproteobacteria bacterium]
MWLPLRWSIALALFMGTGSVLLYCALTEKPAVVVVVAATGAPSPGAALAIPPLHAADVPRERRHPRAPEPVDERASPAPAGTTTGDEQLAQRLFEGAVSRLRERDTASACVALRRVMATAAPGSIWRDKAELLRDLRCS